MSIIRHLSNFYQVDEKVMKEFVEGVYAAASDKELISSCMYKSFDPVAVLQALTKQKTIDVVRVAVFGIYRGNRLPVEGPVAEAARGWIVRGGVKGSDRLNPVRVGQSLMPMILGALVAGPASALVQARVPSSPLPPILQTPSLSGCWLSQPVTEDLKAFRLAFSTLLANASGVAAPLRYGEIDSFHALAQARSLPVVTNMGYGFVDKIDGSYCIRSICEIAGRGVAGAESDYVPKEGIDPTPFTPIMIGHRGSRDSAYMSTTDQESQLAGDVVSPTHTSTRRRAASGVVVEPAEPSPEDAPMTH